MYIFGLNSPPSPLISAISLDRSYQGFRWSSSVISPVSALPSAGTRRNLA